MKNKINTVREIKKIEEARSAEYTTFLIFNSL